MTYWLSDVVCDEDACCGRDDVVVELGYLLCNEALWPGRDDEIFEVLNSL
jgi:hypothetical protein